MSSSSEEYKKSVKKNLDLILEAFARVAVGDFSKRIDLSQLPPDDDFTTTLCGLDMMMDDLIDAQKELAEIHQKLEQQVSERTSQLTAANKQLNCEIEERKKIEASLRESEEHYRLLAESADDFIYIFDRGMNITYANNAVTRLVGRPKEEIVGRNVQDLLPVPGIRLRSMDELLKAVNDKVSLSRQMKMRFPSGEIWIDTVLVPIADPKGDVTSMMGISRDITQQKQAADALAEREKFLADIFSSFQDGISVLDSDLTILRVNAKMEQWYAHAMPIVGKKCYAVYHSRTEPCHACPSIAAIRTKKAAYEVVPLHGENGQVLGWQDLYAFPMFDEGSGKVKGVIEQVRDITVRRQAEEKLKQSEALFRTLAETAGAGIFIVKNMKICYVNTRLTIATGYTKEELLGMNFWDIVHPDFREEIKQRYAARMRGEQLNPEYEFKFLRKDGTDGWVSHFVGLIEYEGGPAVIGTLFITTERKKAEQALAEEKELLSVTMASIGDGVVSTDNNGVVLTINKNAMEIAGDLSGGPAGRHIDEVMCFIDEKTKEPFPNIICTMVKRYGIQRHERRVMLRNAKGAERLVDLSVAPITTDKGATIGMVLVFRDVTERQKLEEELFKARKLESLGVLAGGIAHDFNNILTGVITNLFMAKVRIKSDKETQQLIAEAEKASFRASKLVKQLLTFSKGGAPVKEAVSVKDIIEDSVGFCLSGSNVSYKLEIAPDLSLVEADRGQIDQVLNNLIINADQAMPSGGHITVKAENITLPAAGQGAESPEPALPSGAYVKVTVADQGVGIPKEDLEKIFDPYFTTKPNGNGLGLTIAYSIIKSHKGFIAVDSQVGKGTVFSFFLPVAQPAPAPWGPGAHAAGPPGTMRVLVMDDDSAVRVVVTQLLKNSGYKVVCTSSGEESITAYGEAMRSGDPFDVVVMDLTVPGGMGGKETVQKILELDPKAKVIVSSGYSNDPIMANFRDYGFCGVIAKPFNIDEFLSVIQKTIAASSTKDEKKSDQERCHA
ncbi:MAG TPA: PAS domain S-box protein [Chitinivibrionales bacterium]|nr:PAS domain S-box protein [Chitinivibrionales bacterium]